MTKILIKLNIEKDAWNWWEACNKVSHGVDWKMEIELKLRNKIVGKSQKEAYGFLFPYLKDIYKKRNLKKKAEELQKGFSERQKELFKTMERITMRKIYRNNFICFLTTFPRFPYDYNKGYVWISSKRELDYHFSIFLHELLHFQYFAYYGEKAWDELGQEKYEYLKEAMTVILNEECKHITKTKDEGYEIHKELRDELLKIWLETRKFDLFFNKAIEVTKDFKIKL
ncbi:MAG: hypothetical protein ABIA02_01210 [Candidatus Falkowbacteria bacterium]